ncbi:DUF4288 domain-containing protein [Vitiosangium sp. GDMCC 1.1324]|uniref:DUF4288 domain-containing protein n=1 Tax=Vitiosangium sp. (strain GDMCC 1.1324) TaxID=2138576 RepID=UPI00130DC2FA|nr:DUF4288 domain-containing protein [Vitiosangium sp. GDMCC 1.1324]
MSEERPKHFYIAVLLYESTSESGDKEPMYQESFVLLQATNEEEARARALEHARRQDIRYESAEGKTIRWSLKHMVDVSPALDDNLKDGSELYARHFKNYDAYRAFEPLLGGTVDP